MRRARCLSVVITIAVGLGIACGRSPATPTLPAIATPPIPAGVSATIAGMLSKLAAYIRAAYEENRDMLPRNQHLAVQLNAKMTMLSAPGLITSIFDNRRWVDGLAPTAVDGATPIGAVFPTEEMRAECSEAVHVLESVLPVLVSYFGEPFPTGRLELWYGFKVGGTGGGGAIFIVDRTTSATLPGSSLPYDTSLAHEASHSYISNEALNQFLEVYVDNVRRGRGAELSGWDYTRGWSPGTPTGFGVDFVLDVYQMVGPEVMQRAYRAILPLHPPYGQPLSQTVINTFVAQVPEAVREAVRAKLGQIIA